MVVGVTDGFRKDLDIVGVGYRAAAKGPSKLELALGFSHPVVVDAPDGITFEVAEPTRIAVVGIDKELSARSPPTSAALRKPEPYKGKGVALPRRARASARPERQRSRHVMSTAQAEAGRPHPPPPPGAQAGARAPPSVRVWPCSARTATSAPR